MDLARQVATLEREIANLTETAAKGGAVPILVEMKNGDGSAHSLMVEVQYGEYWLLVR
jgi:hypothetical protein